MSFCTILFLASYASGSRGGRELSWNGDAPGGLWEHNNPLNLGWTDNANSQPAFFINGDGANFTGAGAGNVVVAAPGGVVPSAVNVAGSESYSITGGPIAGAAVLTKDGPGILQLSSANTYTGGTVIRAGVTFMNNGSIGAGQLTLEGGTVVLGLTGFSFAAPVVVSGTNVTLQYNNPATFTGPISGAGNLIVGGNTLMTVSNFRLGGLSVFANIRVAPQPAPASPAGLSTLGSFTIGGGPTSPNGKFDLTNNAMIVRAPVAGPEAALEDMRDYIRSAYASGAWTGNGVTSTSADATRFAVGYARAGAVGILNFAGTPVAPDDVLARFTRYGDATLDGVVNLDDFNRLATNFNTTGKLWSDGNFNYDAVGLVDLDDFNLLAGNFNLSAGPDGIVDPEDWAALAAAVPEPATVLMLLVGLAGLHHRKYCSRDSRRSFA